MTNKLESFLMQKLDNLPQFTFSPAMNDVMTMLDDPSIPMEVIAAKIQGDPVLSKAVLNTSSQTAQRTMQSVHQAIRLTGLQTVKAFITSTLEADTQTTVDGGTFEIMQGRLWHHSQHVAICCQLLAAEWDYPNLSQAYTAGLFHDIGEAILNAFAYDEICDAIKLTQAKAIATYTAEDRALGFNHAYFGAKVAERWGLPPAIIEPIALHHQPKEAVINKKLVKIVHLADVAAHCQHTKLPLGISLFPVDKSVLAELPFPKEHLMELAQKAADLLAKIESSAPATAAT